MKPFRFLHLSLALGLAAAPFSSPSRAEIISGKEKCVEDFSAEIKKIGNLDLSKIEPQSYCRASEGAENNKIIDPSQRPKLKIGNEEVSTSFPGACPSSYEAVQLVYENLIKSRKETCERIYSEMEEKFPECLDKKPANTCKDHIDEMAGIYKSGKLRLEKDIRDSIAFLNKYPEWNTAAKDKYVADLNQLQSIRNLGDPARTQQILAGAATPPEAQHSIQAASQGATSLGDYLSKLEARKSRTVASNVTASEIPATSPIDEQKDAEKVVKEFRDKLKKFKDKESTDFEAKLAGFREKLNRATDTASLGDNFKKYAPTAAPLASTFMNNQGGGAAPSSIGGGSGTLPALALAGAAGMALGAGGKSSGSSRDGSEGPVMTPNNTADPTRFGDGSKGAAPTAFVPTAPASVPGEGKDETTPPLGNAAAQAAANSFGGGASSSPGAGKSKSNARRDTASTAALPAGEDALKPFAGDLRPTPRPAAAPDTTGNEVSSLLGKMKDLFNLDENFGAEASPMDHAASGNAPSDSSVPVIGEGDYSADEYNEGGEYQAEESAAGEEAMQGSSPLGNIEVTLFRRVHARHFKCMEKGLVLLMSKELPE